MPDGAEASWEGSPARLDRVLAELGLARSRSRASELIAEGRVRIDGAPAAKAGARVGEGSLVSVTGEDRYVSRAAAKLAAGLDRFGIDPSGRVALDLGASTGGFTQVLLERGARLVQAIDVGHGQMAEEIARDPRVRLAEGCNARDLDRAGLAGRTGIDEAPSLITADLSFISLTLILPAIDRCAADEAELLLLIKPQFEVGRVRDGVVTNPAQWAEAIRTVLDAAAGHGFGCTGLDLSPVVGGNGNREYLGAFARASAPDPTEWEGRIAELCERGAAAADSAA
ncbi:SAM-dependent methyltransferase [Leucobacter ruminantium]|uniref:TlyA family RNA methyltransferase n=1 Tax=Leucobacter ruminantium TaxID=1289170 RepID=A0A939LWN0_9MICO|nr:TlyA family RNA methyltransferase [Leucobacter ruminantium]